MSWPRPTALGIKAAVFFLLLLSAFLATPYSNLFFLLLVFAALLGLLDLVWNRRNLAGLHGAVEEPEPAPAGTAVALRARVDGGSRARHAVAVELDVGGHGRVALAAARLRGGALLEGRAEGLPRGLYPVRSARLVSRWPFGLFWTFRPVEGPSELVVFPLPADLAADASGRGGIEGLEGTTGFQQPSGLREYRPGDELKQVHWKASARRGDLVIKEWEGGTGHGHEIVLDRRADDEGLERALALVSALVVKCREEKEALTLHTQGLSATFGPNHRPWTELLRFLAGADALPAGGPAPPPASPGVLRLGGGA